MAAYAMSSGVIQGGGLHHFWYVLDTALLITASNANVPRAA